MSKQVEFIYGVNDLGKSRSQKKRESTALQKLGEDLCALPASLLHELGLPQDLVEAVGEWHTVKTHEARRRQMQYIGRIIREQDINDLPEKLAGIKQQNLLDAETLHQVEELRAALLDADEHARKEALKLILQRFPQADAEKLQQLVRVALQEKEASTHKRKPPKAFREIFRYLRDLASQPE